MPQEYSMLNVNDVDPERSAKSNTPRIDLGDALGCETMRPMVWFLEPGNDGKNYHSHETQEELYYVLSGPGRMTIAGETKTVPEGTAIRVPPETPRRTFNDTDHEHVWLVVGSPNVDDPGIVHDE